MCYILHFPLSTLIFWLFESTRAVFYGDGTCLEFIWCHSWKVEAPIHVDCRFPSILGTGVFDELFYRIFSCILKIPFHTFFSQEVHQYFLTRRSDRMSIFGKEHFGCELIDHTSWSRPNIYFFSIEVSFCWVFYWICSIFFAFKIF